MKLHRTGSARLCVAALTFTVTLTVTLMLMLGGCQNRSPAPVSVDDAATEAIVAAILRRDTVLFGEVHDNPAQHALRAQIVERALAAGARPALAFEQFDRALQPRIDSALAARPKSSQGFLDTLFPGDSKPKGWQWPLYTPLIDLALAHGLPIIAANLSRADAIKVSMTGLGSAFDVDALKALGLDRDIAASVRDEQRRAIKDGHCNALADDGVNAMATAQLARDAVLAASLRGSNGRGVILFAGNGHTRRDVGVGYWLPAGQRFTSVGLLERGESVSNVSAKFDIVVTTDPHPRADPCIAFRSRAPTNKATN